MPKGKDAVPSLDDLSREPQRAAELSDAQARSIALRCLTILTALSLRDVAPPAVPETPDPAPRVLDAAGLAVRLNRSRSWIYKHPEELPPKRWLGGRPIWLESDVDRWLESQRQLHE